MVNDPYRILGVTPQADDAAIRKAWLEKVRLYPPERSPEKFREVREAYDAIATRTKRLRHYLFSTDCYLSCPIEALTTEIEDPDNRTPPSAETMRSIIRQSFDAVYSRDERRGKK